MELGDFLVEFLGENVDLTLLVFLGVSVKPEINLSNDLISE